ncbi:acetylornithine deacetylase [Acinetobacter baumannii 625974]|uniref:Acetylornithine deacetylase n=1 Tax=Acinetobacter baumannii 625974 TaxID=1310607 RepID=A0A009PA00_ACIBA|nr:acetylornithine deacetylase [Acinetobacter baumannii]EXC04535.1 acetylornithine deacetylase [Acinetobacter baumannii 625974]
MSDLQSTMLLKQLIAFDTTSYKSNLELIYFVKQLLEDHGIEVRLQFNPEKSKACLFASIGPKDVSGILLSGHTDVVPVEGQDWHSDPFVALEKDGKIYGRGCADMKGFIACALNVMLHASTQILCKPLHLCLSYDEEIGCIGVREILQHLSEYMIPPIYCVIGEPTLMQIATGHKGKAVFKAICTGQEGHSALAPQFTNAIHVANALIHSIVDTQQHIARAGEQDSDYDVPYSTLHIGKIEGGKALNIVPNECIVDYEIRNIAQDSSDQIQEKIQQHPALDRFKKFVHIEEVNQYPGLLPSPTVQAVKFMQSLLPENTQTGKISFGTEGGLFANQLHCPVLVCGPGSITVAHKPDEFVEINQLIQCDVFLHKLLQSLQ